MGNIYAMHVTTSVFTLHILRLCNLRENGKNEKEKYIYIFLFANHNAKLQQIFQTKEFQRKMIALFLHFF